MSAAHNVAWARFHRKNHMRAAREFARHGQPENATLCVLRARALNHKLVSLKVQS